MSEEENTLLPAAMSDALRRNDSDRFLASLFAPVEARQHMHALYALDWELKRIPALVSEEMLGAIRFQWWRDTVGSIYQGERPGHELVPALAAAIEAGALPAEAFHSWIDAREDEMSELPFADIKAMEDHARRVEGTIMRLCLKALGAAADESAVPVEHLAPAYGLIDLLKRCGPAAGRRTAFLPADQLAGTDQGLFMGRLSDEARAAMHAVVTRALSLLDGVPSRKVSRDLLPAAVHAGLVPAYARLFMQKGYDPLRMSPEVPAYRRQISLMARAMRGRV